jgi:hypothetical protein
VAKKESLEEHQPIVGPMKKIVTTTNPLIPKKKIR